MLQETDRGLSRHARWLGGPRYRGVQPVRCCLAMLGPFLLLGCTTCVPTVCPAPYSRVVATDLTGGVISEYVAEGAVVESCEGFSFTALERRVYAPHPMTRCYPMGRPVTVQAPNLWASPLYSFEASSLARR